MPKVDGQVDSLASHEFKGAGAAGAACFLYGQFCSLLGEAGGLPLLIELAPYARKPVAPICRLFKLFLRISKEIVWITVFHIFTKMLNFQKGFQALTEG